MIPHTAVCLCGGGVCVWGGEGRNDSLTHLIPPQCLQVIQDLSDEGLAQLVDLRQELGVPSIKRLVGVHCQEERRPTKLNRVHFYSPGVTWLPLR